MSSRPPDHRNEPEKGWSWWYPLIVLVPAMLALFALISSMLQGSDETAASLRGARLGMTADQVRERFDEGAQASWRTEIVGPDMTLIRGPSASLDRETRFEFHNGMLVAIRAELPPDADEARGGAVEISPAAVIARTNDGRGRVHLRVLARDCPTHAEEVSRVLSDAP
ncbi:hypothetical protein [Sandaracinus amylolyticus]|uniref:hypothetical protein n=1 Tax=Sandaracinus amylolyticus TaxID=927083 RepID=UPI001F3D18FE|nr:hypothetical protein [Sandaracinus amylolyticus]UJR80934.1 Hypothetical protein I5071_29850 [Sandaracinus amylolyticus]